MALNTFTIDEAVISIFATDADGSAITGDPIWLGASVEGVRLVESLEEIEDRPSGVIYPVAHHGTERHEITIDRLWEIQVPLVDQPEDLAVTIAATNITAPDNGTDYKLSPGMEYVMVIVWEDEDDPKKRWHYRRYFGVTDRSHEVSGGSASEKKSALSLRAKYYL